MAFDPLNDPTADPGWGKAARESLWGLIPVVSLPRRQRRIAKAVGNDGLVVTRAIFLSFVLALALIGVVVAILTNFSKLGRGPNSLHTPAAVGFGVGVAVVGLGGQLLSARIGGRLPVESTMTPSQIAGAYRVRFFLRVAFSEAAALVGFVGFIVTGRWWQYLIGAAFAGIGFVRLAPTAGNLRRDQLTIDQTRPGLNLIGVLRSTPPPTTGRRAGPRRG